jgi:LPXTG-motif cell wall-anchored protein
LTVLGVLGALFAMPMFAAGAATNGSTGSDGVPPPPPGACVILSTVPNPVPAFPTQVTVSGTAPSIDNTHIVLYANGVPATKNAASDVVAQDVTTGTFTLKYTVLAATDLAVNYTYGNQNAYVAGCATPLSEVVVRVVEVKGAAVTRPADPGARALAFTGSNNTPSYVLVGIAALVLGAVLVIAAKRRSRLS